MGSLAGFFCPATELFCTRFKRGTVGAFVDLLVQLLGVDREREVASGTSATSLSDHVDVSCIDSGEPTLDRRQFLAD